MKHLLKNEEFQLDEILFQGRNKEYGAYNLRNEADKILTKSMFVGIAIFGLVATAPFIVSALKAEVKTDPGLGEGHIFTEVPVEVEVKPPTEVVKPQPQTQVNTVNTQVPTPTANSDNENPPATIDESENAVRGSETIIGDPPVLNYQPPTIPTTGGEIIKDPVVPKKIDENAIPLKVDVEANFAGGIKAFREKIVQNFDTSSFEGTGEKIATTITFIVEKDGTISNVKTNGTDAEFNREAEKTLRKVKGKWTPAQLKGEPVRSYFRFPISMLFE